jgi:hypothetical protein
LQRTSGLKSPLGELKGFRHVIVQAYDLVLDPERIQLLVRHAETVAGKLPGCVDAFLRLVRREIG